MRIAALLFLSLTFAAAAHAEDPVPEKEIAAFLEGTDIRNVRWTKYDGTDFTIYYCIAESPRAGVAGLYLSRNPIETDQNARDIAVDGAFGRFEVKWKRRVIRDGSRQAEAVVQYAPKRWAHVLVEAPDEVGIMRFVSEFGTLAIFAAERNEKRFVGPGFIDTGLRSKPVVKPTAAAN
jgi:hypothetical protein